MTCTALRVTDAISKASPRGSRALSLLESLRPRQWSKNLLVFAGLVFAGRLFDVREAAAAVAAFIVFCALSGTVYLINDVLDRQSDREHPLKRQRPIASGRVSVPLALWTAGGLAVASLAVSAALGRQFVLVALGFLGKAFVICVIGGLGSVGGAIVGGIALGLIESLTALWFGPEYAVPISFALLVAFLAVRPTGLLGRRGYE